MVSPTSNAIAADAWSDQDIALELSWQALHFIDWRQTRTIAKNPDDYYEVNPILGKHPSTTEVDIYMITGAILHPIITHYMPKKYRPTWLTVSLAVSGTCVINNFSVGIKMDF